MPDYHTPITYTFTSTGHDVLDGLLGGGLMARIVEVYSPDLFLASRLAQHIAEHGAFSDVQTVRGGPGVYRDVFDQIEQTVKARKAGRLTVLDSLAETMPQDVEHIEDLRYHRRAWQDLCRRGAALVARPVEQTLLVVNERKPSSNPFGGTTGYNALKFYASQRIEIRAMDDGLVQLHVVKNKGFPPFRRATVPTPWST